ncbi:MAG: hypothetical protein RB292_01915 [Patescibacteria group bacterium]|jgi:cytosine/adenosine deaminase-related metal-dependent hydrolase|nr:hypothetical protein [Patescibacteria group bacterium]
MPNSKKKAAVTVKAEDLGKWYPLDPYAQGFMDMAMENGGFINFHSHLDRAYTLAPEYLEHIGTTPLEMAGAPLTVKQQAVGNIHRGKAYTESDLRDRVSLVLRHLIAYGTTECWTCVDTCPGIAEEGLLAWRVMRELREEFHDRIVLKVGPSPIFGLKQGSGRWETYQAAAQSADFLTGLPEKDDFDVNNGRLHRDGKVGFEQHVRRLVQLACDSNKELHLHLDQTGEPTEHGTFRTIDVIDTMEQEVIDWVIGDGIHPKIWAVHMLSPSSYSEEKFRRLLDALLRLNIGLIVCPTAAVSMRQQRPVMVPMHSSIARMLECLKVGVKVRFGSDNINDMMVPAGDGNMCTEILRVGTHVLRCYLSQVLSKLAAGVALNEVDRARIGNALYQDRQAWARLNPGFQAAVE